MRTKLSPVNVRPGLKVIIVDGSSIIRDRLVDLMIPIPGVSVLAQAGDGLSAAVLIKQTNPDVIVMDVLLPGKDGIALLRHVKQREPSPVAIVLTNSPFKECRANCMKAGADHYFTKFSEFEKITEVLSKLADQRRIFGLNVPRAGDSAGTGMSSKSSSPL